MYGDGDGVPQDVVKAEEWFTKAVEQAENDNGYALHLKLKLGERFFLGKGVLQDHRKAAEWTRKAAEQGHVVAMCTLGEMYHRGEGVLQDDVQAADWWTKAVEHGDANTESLVHQASSPVGLPARKQLELLQQAQLAAAQVRSDAAAAALIEEEEAAEVTRTAHVCRAMCG